MNNIDKRKEEKMLHDYEKLIYKLANKNYQHNTTQHSTKHRIQREMM